jgi:hypothetical protein
MPTTIIALGIIVFAILPGVPAYHLYKLFIGTDWRESFADKTLGVLGYSVGGLLIYSLISYFINLPFPIYVIPNTFSPGIFDQLIILPIAWAYLGHTFGSIMLCSGPQKLDTW